MRRAFGVLVLLLIASFWLGQGLEEQNETPSAMNVQIEPSGRSAKARIENETGFGSLDVNGAGSQSEVGPQGRLEVVNTPARQPGSTAQKILYIKTSALNIRAGPATAHRKIGVAMKGSLVLPLGKSSGDWVYVSHAPSQLFGWVHSAYLTDTLAEPAKKKTVQPKTVEKPKVVARQKPKPKAVKTQKIATKTINRSDAVKEIIRSSIMGYSGSCPCPYNRDRGGRRCGGRSAYSRPGGYAPVCYEGDVTSEMVDRWLARNGG